jgi:hypothetical protein
MLSRRTSAALGLPVVALTLMASGPARASQASDEAYEAGRRHVEAREFAVGLVLLGKAAAADPEAPSGYRARLLQLALLNSQVGRCLSALTSYDRGLQAPKAKVGALRRQRQEIAAEGYGYLRQLLLASQGYRRHVPSRVECALEIAPPEKWSLAIINGAESKIEAGHPLTPTEMANYERHSLRVWLYMTFSELYCRPGRDDTEVIEKVQAAMRSGEPVDPWIVLSSIVDTLAAMVNRSLIDEEMGRAQVVHRELRSSVAALLLKAPRDEGIVARTRAEISVKQVFGQERGAEWFQDLEFATRLVKARQ